MATPKVRLSPSGRDLDLSELDPGLSALRWVDPGTAVPAAERNGSVLAPFATIQAAVDSLEAEGAAQSVVICCPGDYASAAVVWNDPTGELLVLQGFGGCRSIGAISSSLDARLRLVGLGTADDPIASVALTNTSLDVSECAVGSLTASGSSVTVVRSTFEAVVSVGSIEATEGNFAAALTSAGAAIITRSRVRAVSAFAALTAYDSSFESAITIGGGAQVIAHDSAFAGVTGGVWTAYSCAFNAAVSVASMVGEGCTCGGNVTLTNASRLDLFTYRSAVAAGVLTAATLQVDGLSSVAQSIGNNLAAPIVLQALPTGHPRGFYMVSAVIINRTAPSAGTVTRSIAFNTPTVGPTTISSATPVTITQPGQAGGLGLFAGSVVYSDGTAPIVVTLTPAAIAGAPVSDIYVYATQDGRHV